MKYIITTALAFALTMGVYAQNDTMFIHTKHQHIYEFATQDVDSIIFYRTQPTMSLPCEETILQLEQQVSSLKQDTANLNTTIADLQNDIAKLNDTITAKNILIAQLNEALEHCDDAEFILELEQQIAKLNTEVSALKADTVAKGIVIAELNNDILELNTEIAELETEVLELKADTLAKGIVIAELNDEILDLNDTITARNDTIVNLKSNIVNLNTNISNLNTQVSELKTDTLAKGIVIAELEADTLAKGIIIADLNDEILDLNDTISARNVTIQNQNSKIQNQETDISNLNTQVADLKQDTAYLNKLVAILGGGTWTAIAPVTIATCSDASTINLGNISFASAGVWVISSGGINQIWSDVVIATGCDKTDFNSPNTSPYLSDCRNAVGGDQNFHGHYFSWCAVVRYAASLCPAPWRVPTNQDFVDLHTALGSPNNSDGTYTATSGTGIPTGGIWGGSRFTALATILTAESSFYWSSTESSATQAWSLAFDATNVLPQGASNKAIGFALRCVR
jgi:uncharacterized protein (TIGR02145 family)